MRRTLKETLLSSPLPHTTRTAILAEIHEDGTDLTDGAAAAAVNEYCVQELDCKFSGTKLVKMKYFREQKLFV